MKKIFVWVRRLPWLVLVLLIVAGRHSLWAEQTEAVYEDDSSVLSVTVERIDILIKDTVATNFPLLLAFENKLVLTYGLGRHYGPTNRELRPVVVSYDDGKTWSAVPPNSPYEPVTDKTLKVGLRNVPVENGGLVGHMRDGTTLYVDSFVTDFFWDYSDLRGSSRRHIAMRIKDPRFRVRRFSKKGDLAETFTLHLVDLPWEETSGYELYGTIVELKNGDLLAPFQVNVEPMTGNTPILETVIARSEDGGKTFHCLWKFDPAIEKQNGIVRYCEPDLAMLANGDILCVMRTGEDTPLYQSRSANGGVTWTRTESTGWPAVRPQLRLLSNGVLACSTGRGAYGHPQVTSVMFSIDGTGKKWEAPFNFHTGPGCSYTWNLERKGKLEVIYSYSSFGEPESTYPMPFQSIRRAVFTVAKERKKRPHGTGLAVPE